MKTTTPWFLITMAFSAAQCSCMELDKNVALHRAVNEEALINLINFLMDKSTLYSFMWSNMPADESDQANYKAFWWLYYGGKRENGFSGSGNTLQWCKPCTLDPTLCKRNSACALDEKEGTLKLHRHKMTFKFTKLNAFSTTPGDVLAEFDILSGKSREATLFHSGVMHPMGTGRLSLEEEPAPSGTGKAMYWRLTILNTQVTPNECYKLQFKAHEDEDANSFAQGPDKAKLMAMGVMSKYESGCQTGGPITWSYGAAFQVGIGISTLGATMTLSLQVCTGLGGILPRLTCLLKSSVADGEENQYVGAILAVLTEMQDMCTPTVCFQFGFNVVPFPPFLWPVPTVAMWVSMQATGAQDCIVASVQSAIAKAATDALDDAKKKAQKVAKKTILDKIQKFLPKGKFVEKSKANEAVSEEPAATGATSEPKKAKWWKWVKENAWFQTKSLALASWSVASSTYGPIVQLLPFPAIGIRTSTESNIAQSLYSAWASYQSIKAPGKADKKVCDELQKSLADEYTKWKVKSKAFWDSPAQNCKDLRPQVDAAVLSGRTLQNLFTNSPLDLVPLMPQLKKKGAAAKAGWVISLPTISWTTDSILVGIDDSLIRSGSAATSTTTTPCAAWNDFVDTYHNTVAPIVYQITGADQCSIPASVSTPDAALISDIQAEPPAPPVCPTGTKFALLIDETASRAAAKPSHGHMMVKKHAARTEELRAHRARALRARIQMHKRRAHKSHRHDS